MRELAQDFVCTCMAKWRFTKPPCSQQRNKHIKRYTIARLAP